MRDFDLGKFNGKFTDYSAGAKTSSKAAKSMTLFQ